MPCRCCNAHTSCKGFSGYPEIKHEEINSLLKEAANHIKEYYTDPMYDELSIKREWIQAFDHHLNGCPENNLNK